MERLKLVEVGRILSKTKVGTDLEYKVAGTA